MITHPTHDLADADLTLDRDSRLTPYRGLLFLFWGLILAKCCLAQWAIITYAVPINGLVFVWLPSIIFGAICTIVYAQLTLEEFRRASLTTNLVRGIWFACAVALALLGIVGVGFQGLSPWVLPAMLAVVLGLGYCIHAFLDKHRLFWFCAIGWWLGAIWLFYLADVATLAWLAGLLIAFQVAPTTFLYFERRRRAKATAR